MDLGSELLKSLIDESVQRVLEKNKLSEEYYKNLNKHTQCTKCYNKITRDNYQKDRSICRKCYSKYMLEYNSSKRSDLVNLIIQITLLVLGNKFVLGNKIFQIKKLERANKLELRNKIVQKIKSVQI